MAEPIAGGKYEEYEDWIYGALIELDCWRKISEYAYTEMDKTERNIRAWTDESNKLINKLLKKTGTHAMKAAKSMKKAKNTAKSMNRVSDHIRNEKMKKTPKSMKKKAKSMKAAKSMKS